MCHTRLFGVTLSGRTLWHKNRTYDNPLEVPQFIYRNRWCVRTPCNQTVVNGKHVATPVKVFEVGYLTKALMDYFSDPKPLGDYILGRRDGNFANNHITNLVWQTREEYGQESKPHTFDMKVRTLRNAGKSELEAMEALTPSNILARHWENTSTRPSRNMNIYGMDF
jgi:hypothetical protein